MPWSLAYALQLGLSPSFSLFLNLTAAFNQVDCSLLPQTHWGDHTFLASLLPHWFILSSQIILNTRVTTV